MYTFGSVSLTGLFSPGSEAVQPCGLSGDIVSGHGPLIRVGLSKADSCVRAQDPKALLMCFFKHSDRARVRSIRVDGLDYRGGRLVAPRIDPETGCTAEEMCETLVRRANTISLKDRASRDS